MNNDLYARVAVFRPLRGTFEYVVPPELTAEVEPGSLCRLPFNRGLERGVILQLSEEKNYSGSLSKLDSLLLPRPLPPQLIQLARWIEKQTLIPLGAVFDLIVPADLSVKRGLPARFEPACTFNQLSSVLEELEGKAPQQRAVLNFLLTLDQPIEAGRIMGEVGCSRSPIKALLDKGYVRELPPDRWEGIDTSFLAHCKGPKRGPMAEDEQALGSFSLKDKLNEGFKALSLTGSRNRRLNLYRSLSVQLEEGEPLLVVCPDVHSTEELALFFKRCGAGKAVTYHGELSPGETASVWKSCLKGEGGIVVGTWKALFLPFKELGAIVFEAEGDGKYEPGRFPPRIGYGEIALQRARLNDVPLFLADFIPSIRSFYRREVGAKHYQALDLKGEENRANLEVVEAPKNEGKELGGELRDRLGECFRREEGAILVGERKGDATALFCPDCQQVLRCDHCGLPLVFYRSGSVGRCPYCGRTFAVFPCPSCGGKEVKPLGGGLGKVRNELREIFPQLRVEEFTGESGWKDYFKFMGMLEKGELDLVLGTGLLPGVFLPDRVALLGFLGVDLALNRPHYRSSELLLGRISRGADRLGPDKRVIVQTGSVENEAIRSARDGRWRRFYDEELRDRKSLGYPPFRKLITIFLSAPDEEGGRKRAKRLKKKLREELADVQALGPSRPYPPRGREGERFSLLVKVDDVSELTDRLRPLVEKKEWSDLKIQLQG